MRWCGDMMMCLFLVMVKTHEDMVFLKRVSTPNSDTILLENLRRQLMSNNFDYVADEPQLPANETRRTANEVRVFAKQLRRAANHSRIFAKKLRRHTNVSGRTANESRRFAKKLRRAAKHHRRYNNPTINNPNLATLTDDKRNALQAKQHNSSQDSSSKQHARRQLIEVRDAMTLIKMSPRPIDSYNVDFRPRWLTTTDKNFNYRSHFTDDTRKLNFVNSTPNNINIVNKNAKYVNDNVKLVNENAKHANEDTKNTTMSKLRTHQSSNYSLVASDDVLKNVSQITTESTIVNVDAQTSKGTLSYDWSTKIVETAINQNTKKFSTVTQNSPKDLNEFKFKPKIMLLNATQDVDEGNVSVKDLLEKALRLASGQIPAPATMRRPPYRRYYRYFHRRMAGNSGSGVTFTARRFRFRRI